MLRYTSTDTSMCMAPASSNETSAGLLNESPSSSASSNGSTRWANYGRWEDELSSPESTGGSYLLKEKYGTYFQVPNPASLMTKIICTIGPATGDLTTLGRMMDAGMTAARINMSHGGSDYTAASKMIDNIRQVAQTRRKLCPIILDTKGPEIRVCWLGETNKSSRASSADSSANSERLRLQTGTSAVLLTGKHIETTSMSTTVRDNILQRRYRIA
jgi:hypothetical protein